MCGHVNYVLTTVFPWLRRCDVIAKGVLNAAKNIGMKKPIIIRLKGTNVAEAKKLIAVSTVSCCPRSNRLSFWQLSTVSFSFM
jgi:succinyl-CoA synthetase beta subunit